MSGCGGCTTGNSYNPGGHYVGIRVNDHEDGRVVFCETQGASLEKGQRVIVEGDQGLEYGQVTTLHPMIVKQCQLREARRLVRPANDADTASYEAKVERETRFFADTRELASEKRLPMKLVRAEESFDARKYTVYYTSETRIDYRKLVADLAVKYPARIEMRQVGPRDETKMRGGPRALRPDPLLLHVSEGLSPGHHQDGQEPEPLAKSLQNLGDVRAADVLPGLRGRGRQTRPGRPGGRRKPENISPETV